MDYATKAEEIKVAVLLPSWRLGVTVNAKTLSWSTLRDLNPKNSRLKLDMYVNSIKRRYKGNQ